MVLVWRSKARRSLRFTSVLVLFGFATIETE